jgi:ABC-type glutathione transport system ATPase component
MAGTGKAHLRDGDKVLSIEDLVVEFKVSRNKTVKAVSGISFDVLRGETLGIVGESGCGKSTTGRAIMQIPPPTSGSIVFEGNELTELSHTKVREARTQVQMIFQDPVSSLNPRRASRNLEPRHERGAWQVSRRDSRICWHRSRSCCREQAPSVLRGAVPTHFCCASTCAGPNADHLRRASVCT